MPDVAVTKSVAANFYAAAWNKLDASVIKEILDKDVVYYVKKKDKSLSKKTQVLTYLQKNMKKIERASMEYAIYAEIAEDFDDEPCVLLAQGNEDNIINIIKFDIEDKKVTKIKVLPYDVDPDTIWRTGNYPGSSDSIYDNEVKRPNRFADETAKKNQDDEPVYSMDDIKEKFSQTNPDRAKKYKEKSIILAVLLAFFLSGFGLFYVNILHGIINLVAYAFLALIFRGDYIMVLTMTWPWLSATWAYILVKRYNDNAQI